MERIWEDRVDNANFILDDLAPRPPSRHCRVSDMTISLVRASLPSPLSLTAPRCHQHHETGWNETPARMDLSLPWFVQGEGVNLPKIIHNTAAPGRQVARCMIPWPRASPDLEVQRYVGAGRPVSGLRVDSLSGGQGVQEAKARPHPELLTRHWPPGSLLFHTPSRRLAALATMGLMFLC